MDTFLGKLVLTIIPYPIIVTHNKHWLIRALGVIIIIPWLCITFPLTALVLPIELGKLLYEIVKYG